MGRPAHQTPICVPATTKVTQENVRWLFRFGPHVRSKTPVRQPLASTCPRSASRNGAAPRRAIEARRRVEREDLKAVAVRAVPRRWVGRQPSAPAERVAPHRAVVGVARRSGQRVVGEAAVRGRQVGNDDVHQRFGRRAVRVLHHQQQGGGTGRHAGPGQRRRSTLAVSRVATGNGPVLGEGGRRHGDAGRGGGRLGAVADPAFRSGTYAVQRAAEGRRQFLEHGMCLLASSPGTPGTGEGCAPPRRMAPRCRPIGRRGPPRAAVRRGWPVPGYHRQGSMRARRSRSENSMCIPLVGEDRSA